MARPYSMDLRKRAVERALAGESIRNMGARFGVSPSVVSKWSGRLRATGSVAPGPDGRAQAGDLGGASRVCSRRFAEKPELTLRGLQKELSAQGIELSYGAIWAFVQVRNFMR